MINVARSWCRPMSRSQRIAPNVMKLRYAAGEHVMRGCEPPAKTRADAIVSSVVKRGDGCCFAFAGVDVGGSEA